MLFSEANGMSVSLVATVFFSKTYLKRLMSVCVLLTSAVFQCQVFRSTLERMVSDSFVTQSIKAADRDFHTTNEKHRRLQMYPFPLPSILYNDVIWPKR